MPQPSFFPTSPLTRSLRNSSFFTTFLAFLVRTSLTSPRLSMYRPEMFISKDVLVCKSSRSDATRRSLYFPSRSRMSAYLTTKVEILSDVPISSFKMIICVCTAGLGKPFFRKTSWLGPHFSPDGWLSKALFPVSLSFSPLCQLCLFFCGHLNSYHLRLKRKSDVNANHDYTHLYHLLFLSTFSCYVN